ncbi:MAG: EAL domain-containing protein [Burkholderiales bacterium]|nr:EAL domain-containing protein [Burkholderiales bacterium]
MNAFRPLEIRALGATTAAFCVLALALIVCAAVYGIYGWSTVRAERETDLGNLADLAARTANLSLREQATLLPVIAREVTSVGGIRYPLEVAAVLRRHRDAQPDLERITVFAPNGGVVASSTKIDDGSLENLHTDAAFQDLLSGSPHAAGIALGRPIRSTVSQQWILPLHLRVVDPFDGQTRFVLSTAVALVNRQAIWADVILPDQVTMGLIRDDGYLLSRIPMPRDPAQLFASRGTLAVWKQLQVDGFPALGRMNVVGTYDRIPRTVHFHRLADYPVTAYLSIPDHALLSIWKDRVIVPFVLFALSLAGLAFAATWANRQQRQREQERDAGEAALLASAAELKRQGALLKQTQQAARIGGWELDLSSGKIFWTEEMYRLFEVDPETFVPTTESTARFFTPDDREVLRDAFQRSRKHSESWDVELQIESGRGQRRWMRVTGTTEMDALGRAVKMSGAVQDISARREADECIRRLAHYDDLTGLANRNLFLHHLTHALSRALRYRKRLAVLFIDLDRFKVINDTLGHDHGDQLLKVVGQRLSESVRSSDIVARLGGDEFVVLIEEPASADALAEIARKLLQEVARPMSFAGQELMLTTSVGIAMHPDDGADPQALLKHADIAMYRAKEKGKNTFEFYSSNMNTADMDRFALESQLKRAVRERNEFVLHYQPKVSVRDGSITGVEALVRWMNPERGLVSPGQFIPLAEETGLIGAIGQWVLETAARQAVAWAAAGLQPLRVAVNLSARQLHADGFVDGIRTIIAETGVDPAWLEFEITESMMMQDVERVIASLSELKTLGVRIAIDDFGTGYSSLGYLKRLPVDSLKVDRSFVKDIPGDADDATITRAVIALAHSLRLKVVAEGVETEAQLRFLADLDCDEIQGFLFSPPLPTAELEALIGRGENFALRRRRQAA